MKLRSGFSLIELMAAVTVVAIIAAIAYPSYQGQIRKTKRSEGQTALIDALNRQEHFYSTNNTYTTSLAAISMVATTSEGNYLLTARPCLFSTCVATGGETGAGAPQPLSNCVELFADSQGTQNADGNLTIDSRGAKCPTIKW